MMINDDPEWLRLKAFILAKAEEARAQGMRDERVIAEWVFAHDELKDPLIFSSCWSMSPCRWLIANSTPAFSARRSLRRGFGKSLTRCRGSLRPPSQSDSDPARWPEKANDWQAMTALATASSPHFR